MTALATGVAPPLQAWRLMQQLVYCLGELGVQTSYVAEENILNMGDSWLFTGFWFPEKQHASSVSGTRHHGSVSDWLSQTLRIPWTRSSSNVCITGTF